MPLEHQPSAKDPFWEWDGRILDLWMMKALRNSAVKYISEGNSKGSSSACSEPPTDETLQLWYGHVLASVQAVQRIEVVIPIRQEDDEEGEGRPKKRRRRKSRFVLQDPFHVWWISKYHQRPAADQIEEDEDDVDEITPVMGGKLAQLSPGAWFNALAGVNGGIVRTSHPTLPTIREEITKLGSSFTSPVSTIPTPQLYAATLWGVACGIHRLVQSQVNTEIWRSTPVRIQQRLAFDLTDSEFASIRHRVYETVIMGRGLHTDDALSDPNSQLATATISDAVHDTERNHKCPNCGNVDQSSFALDRKNGDIICSNCGVVVSESLMHEGSAYRKFEGEVDRNHHGDAPNSLYSNAHNLGTSLSGVAPSSGIQGWNRGGGKGNLETVLRNTHAYTELNVSQYGDKNRDRRTRIGYKDSQKKEAFVQLTHAGEALHLHDAVVQRAKELFAGFRDDRELVQQFKGVLAACLCEAFDELSKVDKGHGSLVKGMGSLTEHIQQQTTTPDEEPAQLSGRAARRNELHQATMAGRGGLKLPDSSHTKNGSSSTTSRAEEESLGKAAGEWDLEDCRSWLLQVSRRIAQQWVRERPSQEQSLAEVEGSLVEHSIALCEHLEKELEAREKQSHTKQRVVTPRVQDMSKLGIKWQHHHERGSGGRGGVGFSGAANKRKSALPTTRGSTRTAGQVLLLKTAQKLSSILKDERAGNAIHKELMNVMGKQEAQKRKRILEESSRKRWQQMQRKPWLQARATEE